MKRLRKLIRRSISLKICAALAAILLTITLLGDLLVYSYINELLYAASTQQCAAAQAGGAASLRLQIQEIQTLMQSVSSDPEVIRYCKEKETRKEFGTVNLVAQRLRDYVGRQTSLQSISLVCDGEAFWSLYPFENTMTRLLSESWYQAFRPEEASIQFSGPHNLNASKNRNEPFISCKMNIYDPANPSHKLGELLFHLKADELKRELQSLLGGFREFAVVDIHHRQLLYHQAEAASDQISDFLTELPEENWHQTTKTAVPDDGLYSTTPVEPGGLLLISYISQKDMSTGSGLLLYYFGVFSFLTVVITAICCAILVRSMMSPIEVLREGMENFVSGDLSTRISIETGDELEQLGDQFNHMAEDIRALIDRQTEDERQKKKLQFDMLMSRIHPHFLYNTLNSSVFLAKRDGADDCSRMLQALILMLQDGMGIYDGKLYDTLERELKVVEAYCTIQDYRYKDCFQFLTDIDPGTEACLIPKNILQPLVENAIYHGVVPAEEPGIIELSVHDTGAQLEIYLSDSGVGMDEKTLEKLRNGVRTSTTRDGAHSIGVQTIRDRMDYLFNRSYTMEVYSEPGKGTTWFLQFPKIQKGENG